MGGGVIWLFRRKSTKKPAFGERKSTIKSVFQVWDSYIAIFKWGKMTRGKGHKTTPAPEYVSTDSVHFRKINHALFDINVAHRNSNFYKIY